MKLSDINIASKIIVDSVQAESPDPSMEVSIEPMGEPDGDDQQAFKIVIEGKTHADGIEAMQKSLIANAVDA
jgi:hypothetical protein